MNRFTGFILFSLLMQSFLYGYLTQRVGQRAIILFVGLAFALCSMLYMMVSFWRKERLTRQQVPLLFKMNMASALGFLAFYLAIAFIPASVATLLEAAVGPLCILLWSYCRREKYAKGKWALMTSLTVLSCGVAVIFTQVSAITVNELLGMLLSFAAALGAVWVTHYSVVAERDRMSASLILAYRFHLTYLLAFGLYYFSPLQTESSLSFSKNLMLILAGVVIPMYFMQKGIQRCSPMTTMMCLSFLPIVTYLFESLLGGEMNMTVTILMVFGVSASIVQIVVSEQS